jgi:4-amino-4-deoxy-L-arabinose transferase-like glycosyltransferase
VKSPKPRAQTRESRFSLTGFLAGLKDWHILVAILVVHLVLALLLFDPKLSTGGDNAQYIILAKSILQGKYNNLHEPGAPPHSQFPPVFPLLLAPFVALGGNSYVLPKLLVMLCGLLTLWAAYLLVRRLLSGRDWVPVILLLALSPLFLEYVRDVFSEVPFLFFSVLALFFAVRSEVGSNRRLGQVALAGLFAAIAFLTRTQGLTLPAAIALYLLLRRRWRDFSVFAGVFVVVWLPWFIRDLGVPHVGGYKEQLLLKNEYDPAAGYATAGDLLVRVFANARDYGTRIMASLFLPGWTAPGWLSVVVGLVAWALVAVGLVTFGVKRAGLLALYAALAVALLLLWPNYWAGDRFLLPILPVLLLFLMQGLRWVGERLRLRGMVLAATVLVVFGLSLANARRAEANSGSLAAYWRGDKYAGYPDDWRTYFEAAERLRTLTDESAVVVSRKPQFTYLASGRRSFTYPYVADQGAVLRTIDSLQATHVILETFFAQSVKYLYPVLRDHPDRFEQISAVGPRDAPAIIFKVKR